MSDPRETIFRETFVRRFREPEDRETLRRFDDLLLTLSVAAEHYGDGISLTELQLAAAAADLGRVSEYLRIVVEEAGGDEVPALVREAAKWADGVTDLAAEIEVALDDAGGAARAKADALEDGTGATLRRLQAEVRPLLELVVHDCLRDEHVARLKTVGRLVDALEAGP